MDFASAPARSACGVITSGAAAACTVEVPEAKLPKLLSKVSADTAVRLTRDEAWRIAVNIAKLPDLLRKA